MNDLYAENKEFLDRLKKNQEKKVNDLLEENKELISSVKDKVDVIDRTVKQNMNNLDQMVETAVLEVI